MIPKKLLGSNQREKKRTLNPKKDMVRIFAKGKSFPLKSYKKKTKLFYI